MLPGVSLQSTAAKYCTLQFAGIIHHAAGCSGARKKVPKPNGTCTEDLNVNSNISHQILLSPP